MEKRKNLLIIILITIIILLLCMLSYLLFFDKKKELKPTNNPPVNEKEKKEEESEINEENKEQETNKTDIPATTEDVVYKSKDGKNTLKIVNNKVAYYNERKFNIDEIKDSKVYATYEGSFEGESCGQWCDVFLVNKEKKLIETDYPKGDHVPGFIEIDGHYFLCLIEEPFDVIYTTNWKELGIVSSIDSIEYDSKGIYVYESLSEKSTKIKFDYNGNKISVTQTKNELEKNVYKTEDGKFVLKVIDNSDKNAYNAAKNQFNNEETKGYGYLNNDIVGFSNIENYGKYLLYSGDFIQEGQYSLVFLVDTETGKIIEQKKAQNTTNKYSRFSEESNRLTVIKCSAGYFLAIYLDGPFDEEVTVYTTNWKELGYVDMKNIKSDAKGIYVYKNYDSNFKLSGNMIKYDINGNELK